MNWSSASDNMQKPARTTQVKVVNRALASCQVFAVAVNFDSPGTRVGLHSSGHRTKAQHGKHLIRRDKRLRTTAFTVKGAVLLPTF